MWLFSFPPRLRYAVPMEIKLITDDIDKFILNLDAETQARTLRYLDLLEKLEYKLGMPYSKSLRKGLFELRITGNKHVRIIYCFNNGKIYVINAFIKKTDKIPLKELALAEKD